jgi:hypothetical protein
LKKKDSLEMVSETSVMGAREDLVPFTEYGDGYDLRNADTLTEAKQKIDENGSV